LLVLEVLAVEAVAVEAIAVDAVAGVRVNETFATLTTTAGITSCSVANVMNG
jgi:hypothetical protein